MTDTVATVKDAAELDRRRRWYDGWLHESDVSLLIELGHVEEVTRRAGQGDWFCAHGLAAVQHQNGQHAAAIEVLRPFAQTGWWTAMKAVATILADCSRTDEALALCRSKVVSGDRDAIEYSARLLADAGRAGEAVDLLRPGVHDWVHVRTLVEISEGLGRDEEITRLLRQAIDRLRRPGAGFDGIVLHVELLAVVLERQGLVDAAVVLLSENQFSSNIIEQLITVLIRHERYEELGELLAERADAREICHVVEHLPEDVDADRVASAIRAMPDPENCHAAYHPNAALGQLLLRAGRVGEGLAELRKAVDPLDAVSLQFFWTLLLDLGRPDEALALIDDCAVIAGGMTWELLVERAGLLDCCGHTAQAIAELRVRPEVGEPEGAAYLSDLLVSVGRLDEAIAVVEPGFRLGNSIDVMARLMIRQGRVAEGAQLLCRAASVAGWS
ncbi:hypothetical protein ACFVVM_05605 [Nocardia sp. NPDC058176]|uniref:hypothetical protein n=1 Tax=Nocardia sp. NPDC058176 TaxID=3346368 RepID=UPI0036DF500F